MMSSRKRFREGSQHPEGSGFHRGFIFILVILVLKPNVCMLFTLVISYCFCFCAIGMEQLPGSACFSRCSTSVQ